MAGRGEGDEGGEGGADERDATEQGDAAARGVMPAADLAAHVAQEVARLDRLHRAWWHRALDGEKEATDRVLAIQKQKLALLEALARRRHEVAAAGPLVVTYVDDWRDAGR